MTTTSGGRRVALCRGVNVNGRRLAMTDLAAAFERAGCREVETYIQSGNVVFAGGEPAEDRLVARLRAAITEASGLDVPLVVRTAAELAAVVSDNPFLAGPAPSPDADLHVTFLADHPSAARVAALAPDRSPGDRFAVRGRDVFLACPNGYGRTKLTTAWLDKALATTSTCRNWKTTLALLELARRPRA